jgi:hypothetical protein
MTNPIRLLVWAWLAASCLLGCGGTSGTDAGADLAVEAADSLAEADRGPDAVADDASEFDVDPEDGGEGSAEDGPVEAADDGGGADGTGEPSVAGFREGLVATGFELQDGALEFPVFDCCSMITCFGNNPSSPYGMYRLPRGPGQTAANPNEQTDGTSTVWRLRADEAVVFVGPAPPRSAYFGWTGYLYDRARPTLPGREIRFASLGDTANVDSIATQGTPDGAPGAPFEQWTVVVLTADSATAADVRSAAAAAGFPGAWVNTLVVPSSRVVLGLEERADSFGLLVRAALFEDAAEGDAYLAAPPGTVWRVTPTTPRAPEPLAEPPLRPRGTGTAEEPALAAALDRLRDAILDRHGRLEAWEPPVTDVTPEPGSCIAGDRNCNGDNNDTVYFASAAFRLGDAADSLVVVYGVNHEATGKATYSNFAVYEVRRLFGVASVDSRRLAGSAAEYLPGHPLADRLYAWRIGRDCTGDDHCLELDTTCPGLDPDELAVVAFRAYLEPGTDVGPDPAELILDRVVRFR